MFDPENIKVCFEVFSRITRELSSAHDVGEVLDHMARQTAAATGAKGCAIRLLNEKTGLFELSAVWGLSQEYLKKRAY